jgi:hypothetical protein
MSTTGLGHPRGCAAPATLFSVVAAAALLALAPGCGCGGEGSDGGVAESGPICGNANIDPGEECDDGHMCPTATGDGLTDGCSNSCLAETLRSVPVNTITESSQIFPVVAAMPDGYLVVYQDANEKVIDRSEIRGHLFDPAGGPWAAGGPFAAGYDFGVSAAPGSGAMSTPAVSACADGSFAIAWGDTRPPAGLDGSVRARFFAPDSTPAGPDAVISDTFAAGHSFGSGLAGGCLGVTHVFVWQENVEPMPPLSGGSILRARAFDTAGVPLPTDGAGGGDLPFDLEPNVLAGATQPALAVDSVTMSIWVAYSSLPAGQLNDADVFLRRLSSSFGPIGGVEVVEDVGDTSVEGPQIAVASSGAGAIVVWERRGSGMTPNLLRARLYDAAASPHPPVGSVDDGPFTLDALFTGDESLPAPAVAALADDTFVVVWVTASELVVGLNIDADAGGVGATPLATLSDTAACVFLKGPVVAGGPGGGYLAAWETTAPTVDDTSCGLVGCGIRAVAIP